MKTKVNERQKGITLIALVITIIVLLILAGVSIAMLTGDNGILNQANDSKIETAVGTVKAVSYTHLDVYKRQDYILTVRTDKTGLLDTNKLDSCFEYGYKTVIDNIKDINLSLIHI